MTHRLQGFWIQGLLVGLIGYVTVVAVSAILNVVSGHPLFFTPALFGSALFYGLAEPYVIEISPGPVLAYNAVHLLVFIGFGLLASWVTGLAERYPTAQYGILVVLLVVAAHAYAAMLFFALPLMGAEAWWQLGIPASAAAGAMGAFLWHEHPALRRLLREVPMGDVPRSA